jgi:molecular chaperone DnaK
LFVSAPQLKRDSLGGMLPRRIPAASLFMLVLLLVFAGGFWMRVGRKPRPVHPASAIVEVDSPALKGDSLREPIGLETLGGVFTAVLEEGCHLPCQTTQTFSTAEDGQTEIKIALFRGRDSVAANNHSLGTFTVVGIPTMPRGRPSVRITVLAADDRIVIFAQESSGAQLRIERRSSQHAA